MRAMTGDMNIMNLHSRSYSRTFLVAQILKSQNAARQAIIADASRARAGFDLKPLSECDSM